MVTAYTSDLLRAQRIFPSSSGGSPLYDGVFLGLELIKEAANPRKILIVVSGGEDSGTGIHDLQLIAFAMKQPVQRHGIKVNVERPEGSPKLTVWTKSGYVADKESH